MRNTWGEELVRTRYIEEKDCRKISIQSLQPSETIDAALAGLSSKWRNYVVRLLRKFYSVLNKNITGYPSRPYDGRQFNLVPVGLSSLGWWLAVSVWSSTGALLPSWSQWPVSKSRCRLFVWRPFLAPLHWLEKYIWSPTVLCGNHQHRVCCLQDG